MCQDLSGSIASRQPALRQIGGFSTYTLCEVGANLFSIETGLLYRALLLSPSAIRIPSMMQQVLSMSTTDVIFSKLGFEFAPQIGARVYYYDEEGRASYGRVDSIEVAPDVSPC